MVHTYFKSPSTNDTDVTTGNPAAINDIVPTITRGGWYKNIPCLTLEDRSFGYKLLVGMQR